MSWIDSQNMLRTNSHYPIIFGDDISINNTQWRFVGEPLTYMSTTFRRYDEGGLQPVYNYFAPSGVTGGDSNQLVTLINAWQILEDLPGQMYILCLNIHQAECLMRHHYNGVNFDTSSFTLFNINETYWTNGEFAVMQQTNLTPLDPAIIALAYDLTAVSATEIPYVFRLDE